MGNWQQLSPSIPHYLQGAVAYGLTDTGTVRRNNQDNFHIAPELGLTVVADGMGGHQAGEVASAEAIKLLHEFLQGATPDPRRHNLATLGEAIAEVNAALYAANVAHGQPESVGLGMGTTLTGLWQPSPSGPAFVFHVGDSRLYCFRQGRLHQLTRDQTVYQQALEAGMPEPLPPRNLLLQALGPAHEVRPDLLLQQPQPGDVYLLCSDGMYGESAPDAIAAILARAQRTTLDECCARLLELALRDGSRDNITALLLRYHLPHETV